MFVCGCDCAGCGQGHHCDNHDKGCYFNDEEEVSPRTFPLHPPRWCSPQEVPPPSPDGGRWQIPSGDIQEYHVRVALYNPFDDRDPVFTQDADVLAPDERTAVEAALKKLGIVWHGSDGIHGACGVGHNAYMIFDPFSSTHVLSWGFNEQGAKNVADMPSAKHCYLVKVKKISPTEE